MPLRFNITAALASVDEVDFKSVRDSMEISDSVLSKQIATLKDAGYVNIRKVFIGMRPRTYLSLTPAGRGPWTRHVRALK